MSTDEAGAIYQNLTGGPSGVVVTRPGGVPGSVVVTGPSGVPGGVVVTGHGGGSGGVVVTGHGGAILAGPSALRMPSSVGLMGPALAQGPPIPPRVTKH